MKVTTGTVVNGRIEVPGEALPEGQVVTILSPDDQETFELGPVAEAALLESIAAADRGEVISGEALLRALQQDSKRGYR